MREVTDPYGSLRAPEFAVGSSDDFVCFDVGYLRKGAVVIHAVVNCETTYSIEDFAPPKEVPIKDAFRVAVDMIQAALDWCAVNDITHDQEGWNQDPYYFVRHVAQLVIYSKGGG